LVFELRNWYSDEIQTISNRCLILNGILSNRHSTGLDGGIDGGGGINMGSGAQRQTPLLFY
jgi:hypothetical protein